jgi:hypothetical protein
MRQIIGGACDEVIYDDDFVTFGQTSVGQM